MIGKCPKCEAIPNIIVEPLRARDEASQRTLPVLEFLCDQCKTILMSRLIPNGRRKSLQANSAQWGKAPQPTIERCLN